VKDPTAVAQQFADSPLTGGDHDWRWQLYRDLENYKTYKELQSLLTLSSEKSVRDIVEVRNLFTRLEDNETNKELRVLAHGLTLFMLGGKDYNIVDIRSLNDESVIKLGVGDTIKGETSITKGNLRKQYDGEWSYGQSTVAKTNDPTLDYIFVNRLDDADTHITVLSSLIASTVENIREKRISGYCNSFGLTLNQVQNSFHTLLNRDTISGKGHVDGGYADSFGGQPINEIPEEIRVTGSDFTYGSTRLDLYEFHNERKAFNRE
jgi:hypothetical protein